MMFDKTLWNQFKTNRHERRGIFMLLALILLVTIGVKFLISNDPHIQDTDPRLVAVLEEYYQIQEAKPKPKKITYKNDEPRIAKTNKRKNLTHILKSKVVLDYFDPNLADLKKLMSVGFSERQASTVIKFRSKGFGFKKPEDLLKIYNIDTTHVYKLMPYMLFPKTEQQPTASFPSQTSPLAEVVPNQKHKALTPKSYSVLKQRNKVKIEINTATQESLQTIYGIGPTYSKILINYRDLLGGYTNFSQLSEPYKFADSTMTFLLEGLTIDTSIRRKININTAKLPDFYNHPYLTFQQAKVLHPFIERRRPWKDLSQLENILALDKEILTRIKPYLSTSGVELREDYTSR